MSLKSKRISQQMRHWKKMMSNHAILFMSYKQPKDIQDYHALQSETKEIIKKRKNKIPGKTKKKMINPLRKGVDPLNIALF